MRDDGKAAQYIQTNKPAFVYVLECSDGTLYTGWTSDPERRLSAHNAGRGARYTPSRRPVHMVYLQQVQNEGTAKSLEYKIKRLNRRQKLKMIQQYSRHNGGNAMGIVPNIAEAEEILAKYNKEEFHLRHARIVSGVLRYFARQYDPQQEEFWAVVGLLHDLDFELYPEEHCIMTQQLMQTEGVDESVIRSACSHGFGLTSVSYEPTLTMEKVLYAIDELTGLIGAVAIMRPSRSVDDLEVKSVKKKFKQPSFAAGCSREVISRGAEMLEMDLDELIEQTILAMRSLNPEMAL